MRRGWLGALVVLAVWAAVYLPRLGAGGLTSTEGHRAIPGWAMQDSGNWWLPTMFGQAYLRKPPGMPWAVAGSSSVLGQTELAARLPSAIATGVLALACFVFAARWFGSGLAPGLGAVLLPLFWAPGRSAEIEALNNAATGLAVQLIVELTLNRLHRPWAGSVLVAVLGGVCMAAAALAKGPAGFAAIGAAGCAGLVLTPAADGEPKAIARLRVALWLGLAYLIATVLAGAAFLKLIEAAETWQRETARTPVVQNVSEFLWGGEAAVTAAHILKVLSMPIVALASALPVSLALAPSLRRSGAAGSLMARGVAWACVGSLVVLTAAGVHNPRYAMPSLAFLPVLVPFAVLAWPRVGGLMRPALVVLLVGAGVWIGVLEPRQRAKSGREAGVAMARELPDGAMVWADEMIEARPETLWYAKQAAAGAGRRIEPVWVVGMTMLPSLPRQGFLLVRSDELKSELAMYEKAGLMDRLNLKWEGRVHKYSCRLYEKP